MALINCPECGRKISDKANACINCGCPIEMEKIQEEDKLTFINGVEVNLAEIISEYGKNRVEAVKHLRSITGLSLVEAKKIMDKAYKESVPSNDKPKGFWEQVRVEVEKQRQEKTHNKEYQEEVNSGQKNDKIEKLETKSKKLEIKKQKQEIKDLKKVARCPKCGSTSLSAHKKGFGLGKGAVGYMALGPAGILAAGIGKNKVKVTCLNCGKQFKA